MSHRSLREIAKFAAGLVAADFLALIWFSQQGLFPVQWMGATFTADMVLPGLLFDVALVLILVHYGWNIGKLPAMRERTYLLAGGVIFTLIALVHLWRVFTGTYIVIGGWMAPLWLSWVGVIVTAYLAYTSFHFAARMPRKR